MRVITLNMNGIRAAARKGFFEWLPHQKADVICLQEVRIQEHQFTEEMRNPPGFHAEYFLAEKPGYSGVAIYSRQKPDRVRRGIGWKEADQEGRFLQADFGNLSVVSLYLPSGSSGELRQNFKFQFMDQLYTWMKGKRKSRREFLICGDWNIAHTEKDIKNARGNRNNSGFLPEERAWMTEVLDELGWVDTYRHLHPNAEGDGYSWWSNRGNAWANNTGWRIDALLATPNLALTSLKARVYKDKRFSDHAPVFLDLKSTIEYFVQ